MIIIGDKYEQKIYNICYSCNFHHLTIGVFIVQSNNNLNSQKNNINDANTSEKTDSKNISVTSENNTTNILILIKILAKKM